MSDAAGFPLQLVADSRDAGAWHRAEAQRWAPGGAVVLRDVAELELVLALAGAVADPGLADGVRQLLRLPFAQFAFCFDARRLRFVGDPATAPAAAALAREAPGLVLVEEETEAGPPPPAPPSPAPFVLVMSNDAVSNVTKTSETLAEAGREIGLACEVRDTSALRTVATLEPGQLRDGEAAWGRLRSETRAFYDRRLRERAPEGGATVLSLDLHWFVDDRLFLEHEAVARIVSFWFDDVKAWCQGGPNVCLPGAVEKIQEALRHPKVVHCCYGRGQMEEMRRLGLGNVRLSHLAAPASYLRRDAAPEVTGRAAFVGNPGMHPGPVPPAIGALLERGAELEEIRLEARRHALAAATAHFAGIAAREPAFRHWFAQALALRAAAPHASALSLLAKAGRDHAAPFEAVNAAGEMLNAAFFLKMANRFDRPAIVHRLYRAGLADVYSAPGEWADYGIEARPAVTFRELPGTLQRYSVHLNGANASREATANEKLFEIAACGRLSLNLPSPDVDACYAEGEIACAPTLAALEERTRWFLSRPEEALAWGARARARTAREHLWSHRLRALFAA